MRTYIKAAMLIGISSTLIGCSSHVSNKWDCPKQEGYGCISIEAADKRIEKVEKVNRALEIWVKEEGK